MHPTIKIARIAGAIYLSTLPLALYCWSYISKPLQLLTLSEMAIALWLLITGAKVQPLSPEHAVATG